MAGLNRLTGVPWHVEKLTRQEDDERRHRSRCKYYQGKPDGICRIHGERCWGAAHCDHYKEVVKGVDSLPNNKSTKNQVDTKKTASTTSNYKSEDEIHKKLRTPGTLVWHKRNEEVGEIIESTMDKITVKFDSGEIKKYDIEICLSKNVFTILN